MKGIACELKGFGEPQEKSLANKERRLCIWGNDQVSRETLADIAALGDWRQLNKSEGFFAGAYKGRRSLSLFCDRLGVFPLYYTNQKDILFAAPSMKDLLGSIPFEPTPSIEGAVSLFLFGHHLADETIFNEIRRCQGGEVIEYFYDSKDVFSKNWRTPLSYRNSGVEDYSENQTTAFFVRGVESAVHNKEKIIIPLSGGFDSRAVLGAALECVDAERICALTFGGEKTLDYELGKLVARKVGVKSKSFLIGDEIFEKGFQRKRAIDYAYSYSAFATQPPDMLSYLAQEAKEGHPSVWGVGGDAITGSHLDPSDSALKKCDNPEEYAKLLIDKRAYVPLENVAKLLGFDRQEVIRIVAGLVEKSTLDAYDKPWEFLDAWDIFVRGVRELISVLPLSARLWRCPHLSREYFGLMAGQSFGGKINQRSYRVMLASRYKSLFSLPSKRLGGRGLVSATRRDLYSALPWLITSRANNLWKRVCKSDGMGRNYGKDQRFLNSAEGRRRLLSAIEILIEEGIVQQDVDRAFNLVRKNTQLARMMTTIGYAFDK